MRAESMILLGAVVLFALFTAKMWWPFYRIANVVSVHLGTRARTIPTASAPFARIDLPNIERALREMAPSGKRVGVAAAFMSGFKTEDLSGLLNGSSRIAGIRTESMDVGVRESMACMVNGLVLISKPERAVVYVRSEELLGKLEVQVGARDPVVADEILKRIVDGCSKGSVYKGRIISISCEQVKKIGGQCLTLRFHPPAGLDESDLILPAPGLSLIRRNTVGFFETIEAMKKTGRSVKRGLLLYGRPGTGKTMTAKWIASAVPGLTTFFLSADQLFLIKDCCQMARMLAPSMVVMEDIDLVARDRGMQENLESRITLNQILNEMDGVSDNSGILFLMTSNRPEELEHALAGRPGRVDQAIEYPLPDTECRRRLLALYLDGLQTESLDIEDLVARMDGAPPAFIQEVVRKALSLSILEGEGTKLRQDHFRAAIEEMLFTGGNLTRKLLGFHEDLLEG